MANGAFGKDRHIRGAPPDIHQAYAQVLFVLREHGVARGQLLQDHVPNLKGAAAHALFDVLGRIHGAGHQVHLGLEANAGHAQGLLHPLLVIDHILLGQDVKDLLIRRNGHGLSGVEHALDVRRRHFLIPNRNDAVGI